MAQPRQLLLASTSAYRRQLLARLGLRFDIADPEVDERVLPSEAPLFLGLKEIGNEGDVQALAQSATQHYPPGTGRTSTASPTSQSNSLVVMA